MGSRFPILNYSLDEILEVRINFEIDPSFEDEINSERLLFLQKSKTLHIITFKLPKSGTFCQYFETKTHCKTYTSLPFSVPLNFLN